MVSNTIIEYYNGILNIMYKRAVSKGLVSQPVNRNFSSEEVSILCFSSYLRCQKHAFQHTLRATVDPYYARMKIDVR